MRAAVFLSRRGCRTLSRTILQGNSTQLCQIMPNQKIPGLCSIYVIAVNLLMGLLRSKPSDPPQTDWSNEEKKHSSINVILAQAKIWVTILVLWRRGSRLISKMIIWMRRGEIHRQRWSLLEYGVRVKKKREQLPLLAREPDLVGTERWVSVWDLLNDSHQL